MEEKENQKDITIEKLHEEKNDILEFIKITKDMSPEKKEKLRLIAIGMQLVPEKTA
jgi:tRNA A22 N-methylase